MQSDTPRTDAVSWIGASGDREVRADFAEKLERELDAAKAALAEARRMISEINDENERLSAELVSKADELAAAIKQRDEARRDACIFEVIADFNKKYPTGCMTSELARRLARIVADEKEWDCFAQQEGGGA